jgi:hypothetical protein
MYRIRPMALPALLALGGLGLWGSSAPAQYVGGGTAYAPVYGYTPGFGSYGSAYYRAPQQAAGPYSYAAPAPSFRPSVLVPVAPSGRNYPASPGPLYNHGLEAESLPAQIAENIAPARVAPGPVTTWRPGWRWRRTWGRTSRNW